MDLDDELSNWVIATLEASDGTSIIRIRTSRPDLPNIAALETAVVLIVFYEGEGLPSPEVTDVLNAIDRDLDDLSESDVSCLIQVATGRGVREWLFYVSDVHEFKSRMDRLLSAQHRSLVTVSEDHDPAWERWEGLVSAMRDRQRQLS